MKLPVELGDLSDSDPMEACVAENIVDEGCTTRVRTPAAAKRKKIRKQHMLVPVGEGRTCRNLSCQKANVERVKRIRRVPAS